MPPEYLDSPILKKTSVVEVVPLLIGSDFGITAFLLMLAVSIGIQLLIAKIMTPKSPVDVKTNSRLFSNYENVTARNVPVPLGYGRVKVGSIVVSNNLIITNREGQG
jgi:predicted phage tail protein